NFVQLWLFELGLALGHHLAAAVYVGKFWHLVCIIAAPGFCNEAGLVFNFNRQISPSPVAILIFGFIAHAIDFPKVVDDLFVYTVQILYITGLVHLSAGFLCEHRQRCLRFQREFEEWIHIRAATAYGV